MTDDQSGRGLRLAPPPLRVRARVLAAALLELAVGLVGLVLVCRGVYANWGAGWACIAAGAPLFAGFVVHEWRSAGRRERG